MNATNDQLRKQALWNKMRDHGVPGHCREGLCNYILMGAPVGHFLHAVLSNDLTTAVERADLVNQQALPNYIKFLWNEAPRECWGSSRSVDAWLAAARDRLRAAIEAAQPAPGPDVGADEAGDGQPAPDVPDDDAPAQDAPQLSTAEANQEALKQIINRGGQ